MGMRRTQENRSRVDLRAPRSCAEKQNPRKQKGNFGEEPKTDLREDGDEITSKWFFGQKKI
jgi:hypothetical protein